MLYDRIYQMADAIPAIQDMEDVKQEWGIGIAVATFKNLPPTTQEAVLQILQHLRDYSDYSRFDEKLDLASQEQPPEGQQAEDQAFLSIMRDMQNRVNDLVTLLDEISPSSDGGDVGLGSFLSAGNGRTQ